MKIIYQALIGFIGLVSLCSVQAADIKESPDYQAAQDCATALVTATPNVNLQKVIKECSQSSKPSSVEIQAYRDTLVGNGFDPDGKLVAEEKPRAPAARKTNEVPFKMESGVRSTEYGRTHGLPPSQRFIKITSLNNGEIVRKIIVNRGNCFSGFGNGTLNLRMGFGISQQADINCDPIEIQIQADSGTYVFNFNQ